jgi:pimeloyl-ACP methyl ester carboxylesterase
MSHVETNKAGIQYYFEAYSNRNEGIFDVVGHSYGGAVITNAGYNNPNVTGLVYIATIAPDEGQSLSRFVDPTNSPEISSRQWKAYLLKPRNFPRIFCSGC